MSQPAIRAVLRTAAGAASTGAADADLLARFAITRDESAFELLVWRHAALVQRICKEVLRDHHAAEDAAQATFLVLARKAHTFNGRGSVVGWLYRVARRIAVRAAKQQARQRVTSVELDRVPDARPEPDAAPDELAALCAEVDRLPERYRVPVLLCFFEGLSHAEAARRVGWPVGTVAGRLARAKELLGRRLSRKGVAMAAVALALPAGSFVGGTAQAAVAFASPLAVGTVVPGVEPSVIHLAEGALKTMTGLTWKMTAAAAAIVCVVTTVTAGVWNFAVPPVPPPAPVAAPVPEPKKPVEKDRVADAKQRAQSQNNLKQILIAIHNYHDVHGKLPQNIVDKDGRPLLSWRVELLPYIEQWNLYKQLKLDEPWDSADNKKVLVQMPDVFRVGFEAKDETRTYYQAFAGKGTLFEPGKKMTFAQVTDGLSNTLAVVEAGPPVAWTQPIDIDYHPKNPIPKLEGPFSNTLIAATGDGAAHSFRRDLDEKSLRRLIEAADGEPIEVEELHGKFPLTAEDLKIAQEVLKANEKLITAIADQLKEQQKLISELGKLPNAKAQSIDLERLAKMHRELSSALEILKKETESLKEQLEGTPPPPPPAIPKK